MINAQDYYPFGMIMPTKQYRISTSYGGSYRFGFNGKENLNEVKGTGNEQDYGMRIYDPRVGRFLSVDPMAKQYPQLTPYQFASNSPIASIDLDGLEGVMAFGIDGSGMTIRPSTAVQFNKNAARLSFKAAFGEELPESLLIIIIMVQVMCWYTNNQW